MDLDYIKKYTFSMNMDGGSGGVPFTSENSILTTTLVGGSSLNHLVIPGGLIYRSCEYSGRDTNTETDPWKIEVIQEFDPLLDLVSISKKKQNKTMKKKNIPK
jgi:hypothetical protein